MTRVLKFEHSDVLHEWSGGPRTDCCGIRVRETAISKPGTPTCRTRSAQLERWKRERQFRATTVIERDEDGLPVRLRLGRWS